MKHLIEYFQNMKIEFTEESLQNLDEIAQYIYDETQSKNITSKHIRKLRPFIKASLIDFPKLGRPAEEFGINIRKLIYQRYCILYIIQEKGIDIITIYRENLPNI